MNPGWPSMMRGYLHEEERYRKCFSGGWYLTGDLAKRDSDGYFWFVGRADDVIKSSGHRSGPFEVESALMEHPAVAEAGVIGKPDPVAVEDRQGLRRTEAGLRRFRGLRRSFWGTRARRLGAAVAPKEIDFRRQPARRRAAARSCAAAQGARVGPSGGRSVEPRKRRAMSDKVHLGHDAIAWYPRLTFSMMRSGSAVQTNGLGLRLCSPR